MALFDIFRRTRMKSAAIAKDRLQIIVARERSTTRQAPWYLPQLQQELLQVIAKYEHIDVETVTVNLDTTDGAEVLELNIVLPEDSAPIRAPVIEMTSYPA
ncbi:MAG: cell division topological specificity factor MinE [Deltaproteobacteria bacterium]|nr:cell division topological specificity factor MinE [Deltaproteobacteria bacterium]